MEYPFSMQMVSLSRRTARVLPQKVAELPCLIQRGGVPNHMIMDMLFVDMGADDIGVVALGKPLNSSTAQAVCFLRGDLAGDKDCRKW